MRNFDPILSAELDKLVLGTFYLLELQLTANPATYSYYTDSDVPIWHNGHKYLPIGFTFGDITYTNNMNVDKVDVTVDNLNRVFSGLLLNGDVRNKVAIISFGVMLQGEDISYEVGDSVEFGIETGSSTAIVSRLSTANGNAFLDFTKDSILTSNYNKKITLTGVTPVGHYPTVQNNTYVKSTSWYIADLRYYPWFATTPGGSLLDTGANAAWMSDTDKSTNQRFHIDLGSAKTIDQIYYENNHSAGAYTDNGAKNFTLWGSNSSDAFSNLTYFNSWYPVSQTDTYAKATSYYDANTHAYKATDPTQSLIGAGYSNWVASSANNQRFHIDLGSTKVINRIYYENYHSGGITTNIGAKNFTLWGSNTSGDFTNTTYNSTGNWVQLTCSQVTFDEHTGSNIADPKYITVTNTTAYQYYALKFVDNWGNASYLGLRRIELQQTDVTVGWTQLPCSQTTFDRHVAANQADPKYVDVASTTPYRYYAIKIANNWGGTVIGLRRIELRERRQAIGYIEPVKDGVTTYGSEKVTTWASSAAPYNTLTFSGANVTSAINSTVKFASNYSNTFSLTTGKVYKISTTVNLLSGELPYLATALVSGATVKDFLQLKNGLNEFYFIASSTEVYVNFYNNNPTSYSATFSLTEVLSYNTSNEKLGPELVTGFINDARGGAFVYETLTTSGRNITSAINSANMGQCYTNTLHPLPQNKLFKVEYTFTLNSGALPKIGFENGLLVGSIYGIHTPKSGHNVVQYLRSTGETGGLVCWVYEQTGSATNFSISNFSIKEVLNLNGGMYQVRSGQGIWYTPDGTNWTQVTIYNPTQMVQYKDICYATFAAGWRFSKYALSTNTWYEIAATECDLGSMVCTSTHLICSYAVSGIFSYPHTGTTNSWTQISTTATGTKFIVYNDLVHAEFPNGIWRCNNDTANDWTQTSTNVADLPLPNVLPETGVRIVSTSGGSTYNWESFETGFNGADSNGYLYEIENSDIVELEDRSGYSGNIVEELFRGFIGEWEITGDASVTIGVNSEFIMWNKKVLRNHSASCQWTYCGTECGFTPSNALETCDFSYNNCVAKNTVKAGQSLRFGGFRFLPVIAEKEVWWGRTQG